MHCSESDYLVGSVPNLTLPEPSDPSQPLERQVSDSNDIESTGVLSPQQASTIMSTFQVFHSSLPLARLPGYKTAKIQYLDSG